MSCISCFSLSSQRRGFLFFSLLFLSNLFLFPSHTPFTGGDFTSSHTTSSPHCSQPTTGTAVSILFRLKLSSEPPFHSFFLPTHPILGIFAKTVQLLLTRRGDSPERYSSHPSAHKSGEEPRDIASPNQPPCLGIHSFGQLPTSLTHYNGLPFGPHPRAQTNNDITARLAESFHHSGQPPP